MIGPSGGSTSFEAVTSPPGSLDRAHHHPACSGWEPGPRYFVDGLSVQPLEWVTTGLSDLDALLEHAGMAADDVGAEALRKAVPEIADVLGRLLDRVKTGQLALPQGDGETGQRPHRLASLAWTDEFRVHAESLSEACWRPSVTKEDQ